MKTVIYYFSSTGNSLVVAKELVSGLAQAEIIPITQALKTPDARSYDVIGFVYPVYMFGLPLIVRDFLKTLNIKSEAYIFSVATLGGLAGRAHSLAKKILKKRGLNLACGFSVQMPGNYLPLYEAFSKERQAEVFKQQKIKTRLILELVRQRKTGLIEEKPFFLNLLLYKILYWRGSAQIPLSARDFWITEKCTQCGICAKVCPVGNIRLKNGQPVWLTHCQHCLGCLQWCPVEAIQYKKSTLDKKRYRHPDVQIAEIIAQSQ